jgi:hypothetical protein
VKIAVNLTDNCASFIFFLIKKLRVSLTESVLSSSLSGSRPLHL